MAKAKVILLFMKGNKRDIKNKGQINLLSVIYKVLMKIIAKRIDRQLDDNVNVNQTGGRRNISTLDNPSS